MPQLFYHLKNLPSGLCDTNNTQCFRAALPAWRKLGLAAVVDRVDGNGALHRLDDGIDRLAVWPSDGEYLPPEGDQQLVVIDDELSVSWHGDKPPGPDDLDNGNPLRLQTVPLILADGEVWHIPEIREPSGSRLPKDMTRCRKTGRLLTPIKKEYQDLWQETEFWFDLLLKGLTGEADTFVLERALIFATQVMALRYRFCDATQTALRVIDSVNVMSIIEAAVSWPVVLQRFMALIEEDHQQKKSFATLPANVNGSSGQEASDLSTNPHEVSNG